MADLAPVQYVLRLVSVGHLQRVLVDLLRSDPSSKVCTVVQYVLESCAAGLRAWYVHYLHPGVNVVR